MEGDLKNGSPSQRIPMIHSRVDDITENTVPEFNSHWPKNLRSIHTVTKPDTEIKSLDDMDKRDLSAERQKDRTRDGFLEFAVSEYRTAIGHEQSGMAVRSKDIPENVAREWDNR